MRFSTEAALGLSPAGVLMVAKGTAVGAHVDRASCSVGRGSQASGEKVDAFGDNLCSSLLILQCQNNGGVSFVGSARRGGKVAGQSFELDGGVILVDFGLELLHALSGVWEKGEINSMNSNLGPRGIELHAGNVDSRESLQGRKNEWLVFEDSLSGGVLPRGNLQIAPEGSFDLHNAQSGIGTISFFESFVDGAFDIQLLCGGKGVDLIPKKDKLPLVEVR